MKLVQPNFFNETLQQRLSRLAGREVGKPFPKFFITATSKNCIFAENVVVSEPIQFPSLVPVQKVKSLFISSIPMRLTYVVPGTPGTPFLLAETCLN